MLIFQSISGRSSEQSIASYSSRPTVFTALRCLWHYIDFCIYHTDLRVSNHRGHKIISTVTKCSFHSKLESNGIQNWPQLQVFQAYFFNSCNIQGIVQAFHITGLLTTKNDLTLPAFSLRFVDFAVQFHFCCKYSISFHEKQQFKHDHGMIFLD